MNNQQEGRGDCPLHQVLEQSPLHSFVNRRSPVQSGSPAPDSSKEFQGVARIVHLVDSVDNPFLLPLCYHVQNSSADPIDRAPRGLAFSTIAHRSTRSTRSWRGL